MKDFGPKGDGAPGRSCFDQAIEAARARAICVFNGLPAM